MDVKDSVGKGSEGNEKHVIKTGGKPILIVLIEGLVHLFPDIMWKSKFISNKLGYLPEEISK